jgi:hypothetical protein
MEKMTSLRELNTPVYFKMIKENTSNPVMHLMKGFISELSLDGVKIIAWMVESEVETLVHHYVLVKLLFQLPDTASVITAAATTAYFERGKTVSNATKVTFYVSFVTIANSALDIIGEFLLNRATSSASRKIYFSQEKEITKRQRELQLSCKT